MASRRRAHFVAVLPTLVAGFAQAQEPCVPAPLFSGNLVMPAPYDPTYPDAQDVVSMVVGEFTGDTNSDLVLGSAAGRLSLFRGRAAGWDFDPPVTWTVPWAVPTPIMTQLVALAAADFNTDTRLDLVVGDQQTSGTPPTQRIHVMLGNGDGTFQTPTVWGPNTTGARRFGIADFDGDTHRDIMCGGGGMPVTVLWGEGDGTFPTSNQVAPHVDPIGLAVADIDLDGDTDAVVGGAAGGLGAAILRNNGNGTFVIEPLTPGWGFGQTFGELSGDGRPDLVYVALADGTCMVPGSVYVRLNDGTGHFLPYTQYPITTHPCVTEVKGEPVAADLDGDRRAEVVIGRHSGCTATRFIDQVLVFRNAGAGTLIEPPALFHSIGDFGDRVRFAAEDLDHDGRRDLISVNNYFVALMLNDGVGGFLTAHGAPMGPSVAGQCGIVQDAHFKKWRHGDMNGDGRFDLVCVRTVPPAPPEGLVMLQDAQGAFTTVFPVALPEPSITGLAAADLDRDGSDDLAAIFSTSLPPAGDAVRVGLSNGNGTFREWDLYHTASVGPVHVAAGDLNTDLWPDLVVVTVPGGPNGGLSVLLNNKDGTFAPAVPYAVLGASLTTIARIDGDSFPDLAVTTSSSGVTILKNNGDGTFGAPGPLYKFNGVGGTSATFADANGDGSLDMFITNFFFDVIPTSGGIVVALNDGNGVFTYASTLSMFEDYDDSPPAHLDLNSDGKLDVASALQGGAPNAGHIVAWLGNGEGTFGPPTKYGGGGQGLIVADFDTDGRPDLGSPLGCSPDWDLDTHWGFARLLNRTCPACYPDCNGVGGLTVADFGCFQTKFVAGDPYGDCNGAGGLTVADFACFQTKFVAGCP